MYIKLLQYVIALLCLGYLFYCKKIPCKNEVLFVLLVLVLYHFAKEFIFPEHFDPDEVSKINDLEKNETTTYKLSDLEILNHINSIIKNLSSEKLLNDIYVAIDKEVNTEKREQLLALYEMTISSPEVLTKIATKDPQLALSTSMSVAENPELTAPSSMPEPKAQKSKILPKQNKVQKQDDEKKIDVLLKKIEAIENTLQEKNKETVPEFLQKLMAQNKYIDRNGLIKNAIEGDMKYSQLDPRAHQPPVNPKEDDKWDHSEYTILPPSVWRPRMPAEINDTYQEMKCPVCPMQASYPVALKEWDDSRYVISSDNISIDYIKELNKRKL